MCSIRRTRRPRVTVQPSNTQAHQSRCRNRTASTRTDAALIGQLPRFTGPHRFLYGSLVACRPHHTSIPRAGGKSGTDGTFPLPGKMTIAGQSYFPNASIASSRRSIPCPGRPPFCGTNRRSVVCSKVCTNSGVPNRRRARRAISDKVSSIRKRPVCPRALSRRKEAKHRSFACSGYAVLKIQKERRR